MEIRRFDNTLVLLLVALMGLGLVQVYSASYIFATENLGDGLFFVRKQAIFVVLAIMALFLTALLPSKWVRPMAPNLFWLGAIGVILTLIPGVGIRVGGASRWLPLNMGIRWEPSEWVKLFYPLLFAKLWVRGKWHLLGVASFSLFLLLKQPDFGSFAMTVSAALVMVFVLGLPMRWFAGLGASAILGFYLLVWNVVYRRARVLAYLNPWADPGASGFQVIQSMLSFKAGGLTGQGLGRGQGKLFFLPEAHTDFTLSVFAEETGFMGLTLLLFVFGFVVFRGFQIAIRAEDLENKLGALGLSFVFAMSVFINAGVTMGLLPTKGLSLPFISYGGSSLVSFAIAFGLLLNIERSEREARLKKLFGNQ